MISPSTIVICDDSKQSLSGIEQVLSRNHKVQKLDERSQVIEFVEQMQAGIVLLGLNDSYIKDLALCAKMRRFPSTAKARVIMFGDLADSEQGIEALEYGADDFISLPFRTHEVMARVQAQLRRLVEYEVVQNVMVFEDLKLDLDRQEVSIGTLAQAKLVSMSTLEFNLLKYLISNREKVLNRAQILDSVWSCENVGPRTVDAHMVSLRKKIVGSNTNIQTVHGAGYVLRSTRANP
jgi:DNA-binding response OmpR family regulator